MPDTIVALSTPLGRSGIGVVRLSGPASLQIAALIWRDDYTPDPRTAVLKTLKDSAGDAIDEAILTYFKAPNSFTGEDIVEISCHGSPIVLRRVIDECLAAGARLADPGEFSLRALANGRMDLAEVEAIRDLIDARSTAAARQALRQMKGELSHRLQPIKDELLDTIVILESALEFVEDDLPPAQSDALAQRLGQLAADISQMADTFSAGRLIREGLHVAIVGRPNVGKSSLFNALLGSDRAIVTEIPGTTRDQLHERFTFRDIPISLIDTAGLRETTDTVESIGVERARRTMADADVVLVMLDASEPLTAEDRDVIGSSEGLRRIVVLNKIDKPAAGTIEPELDLIAVPISAKTGEGLEGLLEAIVEPFAPSDIDTAGFLIADARHHDLLVRSRDEIEGSIDLLKQKASEELVLVGLHNALRFLGTITGETTTEDMLSRIFSTFCIGK